jgi:hypothetical protein
MQVFGVDRLIRVTRNKQLFFVEKWQYIVDNRPIWIAYWSIRSRSNRRSS